MDDESRKKALSAMRQALRAGRDQRKEDMADAREDLHSTVLDAKAWGHPIDTDYLSEILRRAKSRRILASAKLPRRKKPVDLAAIKDKEVYEKRPSVRALKKSRSAGPGV